MLALRPHLGPKLYFKLLIHHHRAALCGPCFGDMPWLALPYDNRKLKGDLSQQFNVRGIPTLVVLDSSGKHITNEGRQN